LSLLLITLIPIYALKLIVWVGPAELATLFDWKLLEIGILYLDIVLYVFTVLLWAIVFVVEEVQVVRKVLRW
jgi:hypothetical protein